MKKTLISISLALLGPVAMAAQPAWYVGADLSSTKFKVEGESERKTGLGGFVGYAFNDSIALEAQARRLGSWDVEGTDVSANSLSLSLVAKTAVGQQFALYGRLGFARNSIDVSEGNFSASAHKTKALLGIGAEYQIDKQLALRGEFVNLGNNKIGSGADGVSIKMQQFNVGLSYAF